MFILAIHSELIYVIQFQMHLKWARIAGRYVDNIFRLILIYIQYNFNGCRITIKLIESNEDCFHPISLI